MKVPSEVLSAQAIFVNHSGGKDSQAMMALLVRLGLQDKLVVVHADLGEMEWEPMHGWIEKNAFGLPVTVVKARQDFFELCRRYNRLPGGQARFCTSDLKTKPVSDFIRDYCQANGITRAINAIGIRADESPSRAKKEPWKLNKKLSTFGKQIHEWYPIFDYKLPEVKWEVANAGQQLHEVYGKGFSRLSCVFCVFGRIGEHKEAAKLRPALFDKMKQLEIDLGKTIRLKQVKGVKLNKYLSEYC